MRRPLFPGLFAIGSSLLVLVSSTLAANNSRLAVRPDGKFLATANTEFGTVSLADLAKRTKIAEIPVGSAPESICYLGASNRVAVSLSREDRLVIVDWSERKVVRRIDVPDEPYGIAASANGERVYVAHAYPGLITEIDPGAGKILRTIEVGSFPRGVALSSDGKTLYVTHFYTGVLSALDLASGKVVDRWVGASADNLAGQVAVHPTKPIAYIPHIRSRVERAQGTGSIFPFVSVIDLKPGTQKRRVPIGMDNLNGIEVPADPCEIAVSPDGKRNYIVYSGTDDVNVCEVVDGYPLLKPIGGLIPVGKNPKSVAVSPNSEEVYILNAADLAVSIHRASPFRKLAEIKICDESRIEPKILLGMRLFNMAGNPMSSRRWISCASCHPSGDHDGRTWQNPEGKRNTTSMFGMVRTHPLHWSADRDELHDFEHTIRGPLMQGRGLVRGEIPEPLGAPLAGRSEELDALSAFCNALEPTLSPHALGADRLSESAERGRKLFESAETGCVKCHSGPDYSDSSLKVKPFRLHDVGTGKDDPTEKMGTAYDTPSLVGLYRSAPYLHDGSAATLKDVLTSKNPKDLHGKTSRLSPAEVDDLVEFLKSLPYRGRAESVAGKAGRLEISR